MMLDDLKTAIHKTVQYMSGSIDTLYYTDAKKAITGQYGVFHLLTDSYEGSDTGNRYSDVTVQVNTFDNTSQLSTSLSTFTDYIINVLDDKTKIIMANSHSVNYIIRDFIIPATKIDDVWQISVQWTYHIKNA